MNISVIGIGNIGAAITEGLLAAGRSVTIYNRTSSKCEPLAARGADVAATAAEAIRASEFTIVALLDSASTRAVLLSDRTRRALSGRALIVAAAMTPEEVKDLSELVAAEGGRLSEVNILTYPDKIRERSSEFVIAAASGDFPMWDEIFRELGPKIYDAGLVGNVAKVQMSLWLSYMFLTIALGYSLAAFEKQGLPVSVVRAILTDNSALAIAGANDIIPEMSARSYGEGRWSVNNMIQSIDQSVSFAKGLGIDTEVFTAIRSVYARASSMGLGERDVTALYEAINPSI